MPVQIYPEQLRRHMVGDLIDGYLGRVAAGMVLSFIDSDKDTATFELVIKLEREKDEFDHSVFVEAEARQQWIEDVK